jgi:hypothetical protein
MKKLVIKEIPDKNGEITRIQIIEQTHREKSFGKTGESFRYKNFYIQSINHPQISTSENILFVRGKDILMDNTILFVPNSSWLEKMRSAVKAYNEYFCNCKNCVDRHCNSCEVGLK